MGTAPVSMIKLKVFPSTVRVILGLNLGTKGMVQWALTTSSPYVMGLGIAHGGFKGAPWRLNLD